MTERQRQNKEDKIVKFLIDRPCLSVKCVEFNAGIPQSSITKVINKNPGRSLTVEHINNLIPVLKKYGFKD